MRSEKGPLSLSQFQYLIVLCIFKFRVSTICTFGTSESPRRQTCKHANIHSTDTALHFQSSRAMQLRLSGVARLLWSADGSV